MTCILQEMKAQEMKPCEGHAGPWVGQERSPSLHPVGEERSPTPGLGGWPDTGDTGK